jgi:hypothetical protein
MDNSNAKVESDLEMAPQPIEKARFGLGNGSPLPPARDRKQEAFLALRASCC